MSIQICQYCNLHQATYLRAANLLRTLVTIFYLRMASSRPFKNLSTPVRVYPGRPAIHSSTNILPPLIPFDFPWIFLPIVAPASLKHFCRILKWWKHLSFLLPIEWRLRSWISVILQIYKGSSSLQHFSWQKNDLTARSDLVDCTLSDDWKELIAHFFHGWGTFMIF